MGLYVIYMSPCEGYQFIVAEFCDMSGWIEAKPLHIFFLRAVADFLQEDIIYQHSCFVNLIIDGGPKNKNAIAELAQKHEVKKVVVSAYHSQANEMIECRYKLIVEVFSKMSDRESTNWV